MVESWRIIKTKHAARAFDGEGARRYGGRWNSPGQRVVYTSSTISLAVLEVLVHLEQSAFLPAYSLLRVQLDESQLIPLSRTELPKNWRNDPAPSALQAIGDQWLSEGRSLALAVPSALVPHETNYLLNPEHSAFPQIVIEPAQPFLFDRRLLRK